MLFVLSKGMQKKNSVHNYGIYKELGCVACALYDILCTFHISLTTYNAHYTMVFALNATSNLLARLRTSTVLSSASRLTTGKS